MKIQSAAKKLIVISGPTGIGKTSIAVQLAKLLDTVIISADSRQIYREMNIGTAKPSSQEMEGIPHYFIGNVSITEEYSAGRFEKEGLELAYKLFKKHNTLIIVGGTGLYIKALCEGLDQFPDVQPEIVAHLNEIYQKVGIEPLQEKLLKKDPEYYNVVDIQNHRRIIRALSVIEAGGRTYSSYLDKQAKNRDFEIHYLFLKMDRNKLYERINKRVDKMIADGLVDEVKHLFPFRGLKALESVGYQEIFNYLDGDWTLEYAIEKIKQHSRNYAKRQQTWMRKTEGVRWFVAENKAKILVYVKNLGLTKDLGRSPEVDQ